MGSTILPIKNHQPPDSLGRPLIVLTTDLAEKLPFDWRHLPIIRYHKSMRGFAALRDELLPRLHSASRDRLVSS